MEASTLNAPVIDTFFVLFGRSITAHPCNWPSRELTSERRSFHTLAQRYVCNSGRRRRFFRRLRSPFRFTLFGAILFITNFRNVGGTFRLDLFSGHPPPPNALRPGRRAKESSYLDRGSCLFPPSFSLHSTTSPPRAPSSLPVAEWMLQRDRPSTKEW